MLNDTLSTLSVVFTDYPDLDIDKNKINIDAEQKKLQNIKRKLVLSSDSKELELTVPNIWEKLKADPNYFKNEARSLEQFIEKYKYYIETENIKIADEDKKILEKIDTYISDLRNFERMGRIGKRPEIPKSWETVIPMLSDTSSHYESSDYESSGGSDKPRDILKEYAVVNNNSPYGMYGSIQPSYGQQIGQRLGTYGQTVGQPLGTYGQTVGQPLGTYGQTVGQPLGTYGQTVGQPLGTYGQTVGQPIGIRPYPYGINSQPNPYNMSYFNYYPQYNIAKESKSKLSYYITIELEVFPGTDMDTIQKYSVKCQSKFEKIREAWSNLFGFQYRPSLIDDAYMYQTNYMLKTEKEEREKTEREKTEREKTEREKTEREKMEKEKPEKEKTEKEEEANQIQQIAGTKRSETSKKRQKHKNVSKKIKLK